MNRENFLIGTMILLAILTGGIWYAVFIEERSTGLLTVSFLDVGQGDAIFIESPTGVQVLIDAGASRSVLAELGREMPFWDRSIDVVVATHPDVDHIGGMAEVFRRFSVSHIVETGVRNDTAVYTSYTNARDAEAGAVHQARAGMEIDIGGGATLSILFPDRILSGVDPNASSIVARLLYGETSFLLTGDAPISIERYLAGVYGTTLTSDVLKAGHHGSKTSSDTSFVALVDPDVAVISAGLNNRYGHPHKEVLEVFESLGVDILGTYEEGTVNFVSDGVSVWQR